MVQGASSMGRRPGRGSARAEGEPQPTDQASLVDMGE